VLAIASLAKPQALIAACPNFAAAVDYVAGAGPGSVAVGDFNGDGKPDLAIANLQGDTIDVRLNIGNGSFGAPTTLSLAVLSRPDGIVAADFNRDGKADLATSDGGTNKVSILLGNGLGGFASPVDYDTHTAPYAIAVGDFNRDGKPDLVVANYNSNDASILLGIGDGTFAAKVDYSYPAGSSPSFVATGDFNGDGALDFAVTNQDANNVSVRFGVGDGTFGTFSNFGVGTNPSSVVIRDFNRDGKPDLAVTNITSHDVSILIGFGTSFGPATPYPAGVFATAGDFNGDGKIDLAIVDAADTVSVLIGDGNGAFAPKIAYAVGTGAPGQPAVADLNGDGRADIIVPNQQANTVSIKLSTATCSANCGSFAAKVDYPVVGSPYTAVVADFDGDGNSDLAAPNYLGGNVAVLFGNGSTLGSGVTFDAGSGAYSIAVADFNRDGKPDMAVTNQFDGSFSVLTNFGGAFTTADNSLGFTPWSIASGDFNRDGKPDLAIADFSSGSVSITLGAGDGTFVFNNTHAAGTHAFGIATGDLNGDGKLDLAVANEGSDNVTVMTGIGDGSFGTGQDYNVGASPRSVAIGDFNRDGKPDLAVVNSGTTTVSILLANGIGTFATKVDYTVGSNPESVAAADIDGDGRIDLVTANVVSANVSFLRGNGNGTFAAAVPLPVGLQPHSVAVGDFDRDGKPDLAVANVASSNISILGNTCPFANLAITKTHPGDIAQSQFNRYTITVSNVGTGPTSGTVTVSDALPAGLTTRSLSGVGWTCSKATLTCTRGDALAAASAYEVIDLDVTASSNAPSSVTNTASVSGGADIDPDNNTASDPTNISATVLGPPTNLTATAVSTSRIDITWDASTGAASYQLFRSADYSNWIPIASPTTTSFSDTGLPADTTYLYEVVAVDALSNMGNPGRRDLATTILFTDDPILPGVTPIKAIHLNQLRTAVNAVAVAAGNTLHTYTGVIAPGGVIKAEYVQELASYLFIDRFFMSNIDFLYLTESATVGLPVKALHIQELREGVK